MLADKQSHSLMVLPGSAEHARGLAPAVAVAVVVATAAATAPATGAAAVGGAAAGAAAAAMRSRALGSSADAPRHEGKAVTKSLM